MHNRKDKRHKYHHHHYFHYNYNYYTYPGSLKTYFNEGGILWEEEVDKKRRGCYDIKENGKGANEGTIKNDGEREGDGNTGWGENGSREGSERNEVEHEDKKSERRKMNRDENHKKNVNEKVDVSDDRSRNDGEIKKKNETMILEGGKENDSNNVIIPKNELLELPPPPPFPPPPPSFLLNYQNIFSFPPYSSSSFPYSYSCYGSIPYDFV
jgi:hypothetical protein